METIEIEQVLEWAEGHVEDLSKEMQWVRGTGRYGYWSTPFQGAQGRVRTRATSAVAFLEQFHRNWISLVHERSRGVQQ